MQLKKYIFPAILFVVVFSFSGCAILALPFKVVDAVFYILKRIPRPPPGVLPPPYGWI